MGLRRALIALAVASVALLLSSSLASANPILLAPNAANDSSNSSETRKESELTGAAIEAELDRDGALRVQETLSYSFTGEFRGSYRYIPLQPGQEVTDVSVEEAGREYREGGNAGVGTDDVPDSFGVSYVNEGDDRFFQIVWHFRALNETRNFRVSYTLSRAVTAYDDVIDLRLALWGDGWEQDLGQLIGTVELPGETPENQIETWTRPRELDDLRVETRESFVGLIAKNIPDHQAVGLRVMAPRSTLSENPSMAVIKPGSGAEEIRAEEAAINREIAEKKRATQNLWIIVGVFAALVAAGWAGGRRAVARRPQRVFEAGPDRPDDSDPARAAIWVAVAETDSLSELRTDARWKRLAAAGALDLLTQNGALRARSGPEGEMVFERDSKKRLSGVEEELAEIVTNQFRARGGKLNAFYAQADAKPPEPTEEEQNRLSETFASPSLSAKLDELAEGMGLRYHAMERRWVAGGATLVAAMVGAIVIAVSAEPSILSIVAAAVVALGALAAGADISMRTDGLAREDAERSGRWRAYADALTERIEANGEVDPSERPWALATGAIPQRTVSAQMRELSAQAAESEEKASESAAGRRRSRSEDDFASPVATAWLMGVAYPSSSFGALIYPWAPLSLYNPFSPASIEASESVSSSSSYSPSYSSPTSFGGSFGGGGFSGGGGGGAW